MNPKRHIKGIRIYKKYLLNEKGMTLVEVIISLVILGMVLGGVQLLSRFGLVSFSMGNIQTNLQQQLRIADIFITNEARHATELLILEEIPESFDERYNYIFLDVEGNIISSKGTTERTIINKISKLEFSSKNTGELLNFEIHNSEKNQQYSIKKQIYPENLKLLDDIIGNKDAIGIGIRYRSILPLTIDKARLTPGTVGVNYSHRVTSFGGTPPYTFSISGLFGSGLSISDNGILSGIPSNAGEYDLIITVKDSESDEDSYETTLIINNIDDSIPKTPEGLGNEGWLRGNGNSDNIVAATKDTTNRVKLESKHNELTLPSQEADLTAPEIYFESNVSISSKATMTLNSRQIVFRGIVELEKKNNQSSGKLCIKGHFTNEDVTIYFVGGLYEEDIEILKPGTVITIKSACYGGN